MARVYENMKDAVVKVISYQSTMEANLEVMEMKDEESEYGCIYQVREEAAAEQFEVTCGTGVIIKKGFILTSYLVVENAELIFIRKMERNEYYCCSIVKSDPLIDLALLKIERREVEFRTAQVEFALENDARMGSQALLIGHPFGCEYSILTGQVSHPRTSFTGGMVSEFLVNNLHAGRGAEGAPVFDADGLLKGIFCSTEGPDPLGFSVCAHMDVIKDFLVKYLPGKKPKNIVAGDDNKGDDGEEDVDDKEKPRYMVRASGFDGMDVEDDDNNEEDGDLVFYRVAGLFRGCGKILRIFFPLNEETKIRKGYALIEFEDEAGFSKALMKAGKSGRIKVEAVQCKHDQ